jgi:hypothetical protein
MLKYLFALLSLLAFPCLASGADFYWNSDIAEGNWSVTSNWKISGTAGAPLATALPAYGDQAWLRPSLNGSIGATGPITINVDIDAYVSRLNINTGIETINIQTGVTLTNNGTLSATGWQFYGTSGGTVNVDGSLLNERGDGTAITVKIGGSGGGATQTVNINNGGVMTVKDTVNHNGIFGIGNTATGGGSARVNIKAGGLLDVDSYTFGPLVNKKLTITIGGLMKVRGDMVSQIDADILAGYIVGQTGNSHHLHVWTKNEGGQVYTYVPEPTILCLLSIGALFARRRSK